MVVYLSAKADEEDEEGTISRPGSPKEGEVETVDAATEPNKDNVVPVVREKSAASVRIGQ